jgi:hypothetical protein
MQPTAWEGKEEKTTTYAKILLVRKDRGEASEVQDVNFASVHLPTCIMKMP